MAILVKNYLNILFKQKEQDWKVHLISNWQTIIGDLHQHVRLEKIQNDETLVLGVYDSSWMQELYFLSHILIKNINAQLDKPRIKKLRFKHIQHIKPNKDKPLSKPKQKPIPLNLNSKELKTLECITDQELQEVIKQFLLRCHRENQ